MSSVVGRPCLVVRRISVWRADSLTRRLVQVVKVESEDDSFLCTRLCVPCWYYEVHCSRWWLDFDGVDVESLLANCVFDPGHAFVPRVQHRLCRLEDWRHHNDATMVAELKHMWSVHDFNPIESTVSRKIRVLNLLEI